jgi:hypothetical protein
MTTRLLVSLFSFFFLIQVTEAHNDEEFGSSLSFFFGSSGVGPMGMTTKSSAPCRHVILF